MKRINLKPNEMALLFKQRPETRSNGGFQSLLVKLQDQTDRKNGWVLLTDNDLERIPRYAFDYKRGGWESRLLAIFQNALGSRLGR